ncbi:MAG TPA: hypothetical protein VF665_22955, partial [Longimicrobium sp.]
MMDTIPAPQGNERSFGTDSARSGSRSPPDGAPTPPPWEALIRTLGVSLIAIAAVVASLAVARQRQDEARLPEGDRRPQLSPAHGSL